MKKILIVLVIAMLCATSFAACNDEETVVTTELPTIRFSEDGTFKIIQLTDFHEYMLIEEPFEKKNELKPLLKSYIEGVLDVEKPDFVVLTGDNTFCLSWSDVFLGTTINTYKKIAELFENKKVYWTLTFGNHDTEGGTQKDKLIKAVAEYSYFVGGIEDGKTYTQYSSSENDADGDKDDRYGNFSIPVYSQDGGSVAYHLITLDSGSYYQAPPGSVPYRYILSGQTDWYAQRINAIGATVPSVVFTHIPLLEFQEAYDQRNQSIGVWMGISPSDTRSDIFAKAMELGSTKAIFTGHNHSNSWSGFYVDGDKKIMLGVTPAAQADGYEDTTSIMRCRKIVLSADGNLTTSILTSDTTNHPSGVFYDEQLAFSS